MTATAPIRVTTQVRLGELLTDTPLDVDWGEARDTRREGIVIVGSRGQSEIANQKAGRKHRDDAFTIDVVAFCRRPGQDPTGAMTRAGELLAALDDLLAENPLLGYAGNGLPGLISAQLGEWSDHRQPAPDGWIAWCEAAVECRSRLI